MRRVVRKWIPFLIATITGLVVLVGYLFPNQFLVYYLGRQVEWRDVLIEWAVIIAAFAFLLGLFNLLRVHGNRLTRLQQGWLYSLALLLALTVGLAASLLPLLEPLDIVPRELLLKPSSWIFDYAISPVGASLAALVVFTLTLAAFRLLRARRSVSSLLFLVIAVVVLLGSTPLVGLAGPLREVRAWIINVPGMAGVRGLLLGVALGTVITALRVFVASEHPYGE